MKRLTAQTMHCREAEYGQILAKYADDPKTLFIVSSDFCHWGTRFNYTFTDKSKVMIPTKALLAHSPEQHAHRLLYICSAGVDHCSIPARIKEGAPVTCRALYSRPLSGSITRAWN